MTGACSWQTASRWLAFCCWLVVGMAGCTQPGVDTAVRCAATSQCASGFHCSAAGQCVGDVRCTGDADCCLAEACEAGVCRPRVACSASVPCLNPNLRCEAGLCLPAPCSTSAPCASGAACLWGRCQPVVPCGGYCPGNTACASLLGRCIAVPAGANACAAGTLAVVDNEAVLMREGCGSAVAVTTCRALPDLPTQEQSVPAISLAGQTGVWTVARDDRYGDVVLWPSAEGGQMAAPPIVLAGLPAAAPVVGNPAGPRSGVAEPGPDVGRVLAAARGPGDVVHVAAQDASTNGVVHVFWQSGTAPVVTALPIASAGANPATTKASIGAALAIATSPLGLPGIAVVTPPTAGTSGSLTWWQANSAIPASGSAWTSQLVVSSVPVPPAPTCAASCGGSAVCAVVDAKPACVTASTDCTFCLPGEVCSQKVCRKKILPPPPLRTKHPAPGRHVAALWRGNGEVVVAAWDADRLTLWRRLPGDVWTAQTLEAAAVPGGSASFGAFVTMAEAGGSLYLACQDHARGRLLLVQWQAGVWSVEVADSGDRTDGHHDVGADPALVVDSAGAVWLAYQDSRTADLLLWHRTAGGNPVQAVLDSSGASGFSSSLGPLTAGKDGQVRPAFVSTSAATLSSSARLGWQRRWFDWPVTSP